MNIEISLNQGKKYNQYQNRIKKGVEKKERYYKNKNTNTNIKEGFQNNKLFQNVYSDEQQNKVSTHNLNAQDRLTLENLITQYNTLAPLYIAAYQEQTNDLTAIVNREGPENPYRGTNLYFPESGTTGYVTEMGNYKMYSGDAYQYTAGKNGCPSNYTSVDVDNANNVYSPGSILDTSPSLLVGQPLKSGQSCGNEGQNVYVNSMANNTSITYLGCYNQNKAVDNTEYIGNNDFSNPLISNDSYQWVPGVLNPLPWWPFYATIVNNSSFIQVPLPYPAGPQCCLLQNTNNINQDTYLPAGTFTCTLYIAGRNYLNGPNPIQFSIDNIPIITFSPDLTWKFYQVEFTINTEGTHLVTFAGTINESAGGDYGSCIQGVSIKKKADQDVGSQAMQQVNVPYGNIMTFDNCRLYAQDNGYPYFALNNANSNGMGTCMVSTNLVQAQQYGISVDMNPNSVWNSGATGYKLQVNGLQLVLYSMNVHYTEVVAATWPSTVPDDCVSSGIVNSPTATWGSNCPNVTPGNATNGVISAITNSANKYQVAYTVGTGMGTFTYPPTYTFNESMVNGDTRLICSSGAAYVGNPNYPYWTQETQSTCQKRCEDDPNCVAYDMVPNGRNDGTNQCAYFEASNNINPLPNPARDGWLGCFQKVEQPQSGNDPAPDCAKNFDITYKCGNTVKTGHIDGEANGQTFLLDCSAEEASCRSFLIIQDDGNVVLYKGQPGPGGDQGGLWSTGTQNVARSPNPDWEATKGKYGRNYLNVGEYLTSGEWIGANDGSMRLIMQNDGYVSLVINNTSGDCIQIGSNYGGGPKSNAIYQINPVGNKSLIGKVGYVDADSVLREYPSSMLGLSTDYDLMKDTNSWGNNLPGMPYTNSNVNACKTACDDNDNCYGYVYENNTGNCWLKNSTVYPQGSYVNEESGTDLYIRKPEVYNSKSCNKLMNPIDTIQYENYTKGDTMNSSVYCGIGSVGDNQNLMDLENQLAALVDQISAQINILESNNEDLNKEMDKDNLLIHHDLKEYKMIQNQINALLKNPNKINIMSANNMHSNYRSNSMNNGTTTPTTTTEGLLNMSDIDAMATDSDLNVLKNNYQYIFWTIVAIAAVTITINILKK